MRPFRALFVPACLALLATGQAAQAQTEAERQMYEPMFDLALQKLEKERNAVSEVEAELQKESDLVRGCGLLNQSLLHLRQADELLGELKSYAQQLRRRSQIEAVEAQQASTRETIALREGDIERMCQDLPQS